MLEKLFKFVFVLAIGFVIGIATTLYLSARYPDEASRVVDAVKSVVPQRPGSGVPAAASPSGRTTAARSGSSAQVRLIDFGAEWCAPCKVQDPIIENLAAAYSGRVTVTKVDIDKNPDLASRYEVQGVPTLVIERNGQIAGRFMGLQQESVLAAALDDALR